MNSVYTAMYMKHMKQ